MTHMEKQIEITGFYLVDTSQGTVCIPHDLVTVSYEALDDGEWAEFRMCTGDTWHIDPDPLCNGSFEIKECVKDFVDGEVYSIEYRAGCIGRLSAPGYLDCTDWIWGDTEQEVSDALDDLYGE